MTAGREPVRPSERAFVDRLSDWTARVAMHQDWQLTDFLTPREQQLANSAVAHSGLEAAGWGGHADAERQRLLIMPSDWHPQASDFRVAVLHVVGERQFTHGSLLGAVLGTGIDRRKVGDLAVMAGGALIAVDELLAQHLARELRQVGRDAVSVRHNQSALTWPAVEYQPQTVALVSLRLDALVAKVCQWSRAKAAQSVASGQVSVNYVVVEAGDELVEPGDIVSVRGFGRIKVNELCGVSKKGRVQVSVGVLPARARRE